MIFNSMGDDWIKWQKKTYQCFEFALDAFEREFPLLLFIFIIKDKNISWKYDIYIYSFELAKCFELRAENQQTTNDPNNNEEQETLADYERLINYLKNRKLTTEYAMNIGKELFEKFIPEEIKTELRKMLEPESDEPEKWVWIYCDSDSNVRNPVWEWIYTSPESSKPLKEKANKKSFFGRLQKKKQQVGDNNEEKGFFWGDRFYLIRVPEIINDQQTNTVKIENVGIMHDSCSHAKKDNDYIKRYSRKVPTELNILKDDDFNTLNNYDCIHVASDLKSYRDARLIRYGNTLGKAIAEKKSGTNKSHFLFLNICGCDPNTDMQLKWTELASATAKAWIGPSFAFTVNDPSFFPEKFYKVFCGNPIYAAKAATITRKQMNSNNFWRFIYVVKGNPCLKFNWI